MKKVKRFQEGGFNPRFSSDVYERARAQLRDKKLDTSGLDEAISVAKRREDESRPASRKSDEPSEAMKQVMQAAREREEARRAAQQEEASSRASMRSRMADAERTIIERDSPPAVSAETPIRRPAGTDEAIRAQGIQRVTPELDLLGGAGALRAALTGARSLANRGARQAEEAATKAFTRPQAREVRSRDEMVDLVEEGTRRAASERARRAAIAERDRAIREAKKDRRAAAKEARSSRETARMEGESLGPAKPRMNPKRESAPPRDADEMRMAGEGFGFKRGGVTKFAKGGAVSARADGIAQRGKTKCRIY